MLSSVRDTTFINVEKAEYVGTHSHVKVALIVETWGVSQGHNVLYGAGRRRRY